MRNTTVPLLTLGLLLSCAGDSPQGAGTAPPADVASSVGDVLAPADGASGIPDAADAATAPAADVVTTPDAAPQDASADGSAPVPDATSDSDPGGDVPGPADSSTPDGSVPDAGPAEPDAGSPPLVLGGDRPAVVHVPDDYDPAEAWPLVILLHGYSANGFVQDLYLGLSGRTTTDGFLLVVPDGTKDPQGNLFWNATDFCCDFYGNGVDDVSYVLSLIDEAEAAYNVDPKRVYLFGHSNGGFMSYRMACEAGDRIAAIASIAGVTFLDEAKCAGTTPVSVLHVHGTADDTILHAGDVGYPSAEETVARWVARDGCTPDGATGDPLEHDDSVPGPETTVTRWSGCAAGTAVELWSMQGSGHIPGFPASFAADAMAFLLSHAKQ